MAKKNDPGKPGDSKDTEKAGNLEKKTRDDIHKWLNRIDASERYRKKMGMKYRWQRLIEEYRGYFVGLQDSTDIYIPSLNLIFAYVKSETPSLYIRDPKIKVNPKKGSSILSAKVIEKALNYLWRTKRLKRENKKNIVDSLLVGHSWFKTGYTGKFGTIEDGNGNTFEFIENEDFFGYRVPYENITFNPDACDPPYDCTWIAHEVWIPLEELKANKSFKNTNELEATEITDEPNSVIESLSYNEKHRFDPDQKRVKLYEVWDKKSQTVFTITNGCNYYLREPRKWPYEMKGFPFSFLRLNDDPICPYGIPDVFMFEPQVIELMKIRATEIDHLKRFNRQLLLAEGHMSDDAKEQFMQGITGAVIPVRTDNRPLGDIVAPIPYPQIQPDMYQIEERIKEDMLNVSGQNATDRGAIQKTTTRTASELNSVKEGGTNRRSEKVDTIEDFVEDIAGNLVSLLQQLADMPYFIRIAGDEIENEIQELQQRPSASKPGAITNANGFTFTKEDIQGEFDFEVVAGSTKPLDQQQHMEIIQFAFQQLPQLGAIPGGPIMQFFGNDLADQLDMPGLKKAIMDEQKMADQMKQKQAQKADQMQGLQMAHASAELQLKSEHEATKQNEALVNALNLLGNSKESGKAPEKKVSESMSFKDLPPEGQIQMAKQAGIILTPEQVQQLQKLNSQKNTTKSND